MNFKRIAMAEAFCQLSVNLTSNVICQLNFWAFVSCHFRVQSFASWSIKLTQKNKKFALKARVIFFLTLRDEALILIILRTFFGIFASARSARSSAYSVPVCNKARLSPSFSNLWNLLLCVFLIPLLGSGVNLSRTEFTVWARRA